MTSTAGLPLPSLSRGRFAYSQDCNLGEITAYTDESLQSACGVCIAFVERTGGLSTGSYASLDMGEPGNEDETAFANRMLLARALSSVDSSEQIVCPKQVHGTDIVEVLSSSSEYLSDVFERVRQGCDAVLVDCADVAALLRFADCLPLILVAPNGGFAVVHCGWRGTVAGLAGLALAKLAARAGYAPSQINAYIGAYIHSECFEVSEDTHALFVERFGKGCASDGNHISLGHAVRTDLLSAGLASNRIADIEVCTVCSNNRFFSYRAQDGVCGRHAAFAVRTMG